MQPPQNLASLAAAFVCGHCGTPAQPDISYDEDSRAWHVLLLHDETCPVYLGHVDTTPSITRAYKAATGRKDN